MNFQGKMKLSLLLFKHQLCMIKLPAIVYLCKVNTCGHILRKRNSRILSNKRAYEYFLAPAIV